MFGTQIFSRGGKFPRLGNGSYLWRGMWRRKLSSRVPPSGCAPCGARSGASWCESARPQRRAPAAPPAPGWRPARRARRPARRPPPARAARTPGPGWVPWARWAMEARSCLQTQNKPGVSHPAAWTPERERGASPRGRFNHPLSLPPPLLLPSARPGSGTHSTVTHKRGSSAA